MGLGRGVDGSKPNPWRNKSSYQVRNITRKNIIGTEEGGAIHSYEKEMQSMSVKHVSLSLSITVPNSPVTLGLEGEGSESKTMTQKAVGKKVVNRTISFLANYEEAKSKGKSESENHQINSENDYTFEERVSDYILTAIEQSGANTGITRNRQPVKELADYVQRPEFDDKKMYEIYTHCRDFVKKYQITHYVSSISLGASSYQLLSEEEYVKKVGSSGSVGLETVAKSTLKATKTNGVFKKSTVTKEIG